MIELIFTGSAENHIKNNFLVWFKTPMGLKIVAGGRGGDSWFVIPTETKDLSVSVTNQDQNLKKNAAAHLPLTVISSETAAARLPHSISLISISKHPPPPLLILSPIPPPFPYQGQA